MGPCERAAAARHAQIFIPAEALRGCCRGRAAGFGAAAVLLAAFVLALMADEERAEAESPQTPPLRVEPTLADLERQVQSLDNRITSLEISLADLLRILIGITTEQRAAPPPRRDYGQALRNLATGGSTSSSSADPPGAAEAAGDHPGAADDAGAPPARRRRLD